MSSLVFPLLQESGPRPSVSFGRTERSRAATRLLLSFLPSPRGSTDSVTWTWIELRLRVGRSGDGCRKGGRKRERVFLQPQLPSTHSSSLPSLQHVLHLRQLQILRRRRWTLQRSHRRRYRFVLRQSLEEGRRRGEDAHSSELGGSLLQFLPFLHTHVGSQLTLTSTFVSIDSISRRQ